MLLPCISVVVPVYNSEASLLLLVERLSPVLESCARQHEIILVNDGSRDGSWALIEVLQPSHPTVRGIDLMRNFGQHNALLCGVRAARYEIVVTLDDDLQHPPEELPVLLNKLAEGYDVVYGAPRQERHSLWRNLSSAVTKYVLQASMGVEVARQASAFRAFRAPLREAFAGFQAPYVSLDVLLTWGTTRFAAVPVRHDAREFGTSNYTLRKLVVHALNMLTGFSTAPLRLASLVGFGFTLFGFAVLAYVIGRYMLLGYSIPGFPFLACVISIFAGAQLFSLGILGEYLARMHVRLMDRPVYVVRNHDTESAADPLNETATQPIDETGRLDRT